MILADFVSGENGPLTAGRDKGSDYTGGAGADSFEGTQATLTVFDDLDGGDGSDTLELTLTAAVAAIPAGVEVASIETVIIDTTDDLTGDISGWTGVKTLDVAGAVAAKDIDLTASASGLVAITNVSGDVTLTNATAAAISVTTAGVGKIDVTGGSAVTAVAENGTVTVTGGEALTTVAVFNGGVTQITGAAITDVSLDHVGGNATVTSDALTNLDLARSSNDVTVTAGVATRTLNLDLDYATGGTVTDAEATTLAVTSTDNASSGVTLAAAKATTVTIDAAVDIEITDLKVAAAKSLTVSGAGAVTITANTGATWTSISSANSTGGLTVTGALGVGVAFTGGDGDDSIKVGASTKTITLGDGDDTVIYTGALGAKGSVAAGEGDDTVVMTSASADAADGDKTFNTTFSGFEVLYLSDQLAAATTLDLDGLNNVGRVVLAAGSDDDATSVIDNLDSGGEISFLDDSSGLVVQVDGAVFGASDTLSLDLSKTGAVLAAGTVTAADVESISITVEDAGAVDTAAVTHTMTLVATSATSIVVSGNNGLTLTNAGNTAITSFDASGVVANSKIDTAANLAVTFLSANTTAGATISITGGEGSDVLTGVTGKDVISGGAGADAITGGLGVDTLTGGSGVDTFKYAAATAGTSGALTGGGSITDIDVITDFTGGATGDVLDHSVGIAGDVLTAAQLAVVAAEATLLDAVNAALTVTDNSEWTAFEWNDVTYALWDTDDTFDNTNGLLVQLTGVDVTTLVNANFS